MVSASQVGRRESRHITPNLSFALVSIREIAAACLARSPGGGQSTESCGAGTWRNGEPLLLG